MRAITQRFHKVEFYRETETDFGPLYSHSETADGMPIVRANTPRVTPLPGDGALTVTPTMAFLVDDTLEEELFLW